MHLQSSAMEESNLLQYFEGKTIFITGATGFLAKIFVEKILRVQPNVKKLYLLIRKTGKQSIEQRLQEEVVDKELFGVLREKLGEEFYSIISSKVIPISGDVAYENLGIVDLEMRKTMWGEIDIIINSAATTKFDERYDVAFGINVLGAMHVLDFATKCSKLQTLLHVSTAFVHGTRAGVIEEKALEMGETLSGAKITYLDMETEKLVIKEHLQLLENDEKLNEKDINRAMKDLGIQRAMLHGWPNTYVFTKAIGEMVLEKFKEKANVIILRPTIITSTFQEPIPGWIEGLRTLDSIFAAYAKGKLKFFVGDPESILDMIPGDMVVNCMLATLASCSNEKRDLVVYHVGSSHQNPMKYEEMKWAMYRYLTKNPIIDSSGKPIKVGEPKILTTMDSFNSYISIYYLPFLKVLNVMNKLFFNHFESVYTDARRKVNAALRLAELYRPYLFSEAVFDDSNTEKLRMRIRESNVKVELLNFDPKSIVWDDYFMDTHFRGLVKYVMK